MDTSPHLPDIRGFAGQDLGQALAPLQAPAYRIRQIQEWIWKKGARNFQSMTNIDTRTREFLSQHFSFPILQVDKVLKSEDATLKFRFLTHDDHYIESVLIPHESRLTLCLSTQIGCSLSCSFCATGRLRRERNLSAPEIYDQIHHLRTYCLKTYAKPPTHIVFMGMGEPLLNYKALLTAIGYLTSPEIFAMSARRITISTAGIGKKIKQLGDDKVRSELALSLHAPKDEKRNKIMPINGSNNIPTLIKALNYFHEKTKNKITLEYLLLGNFNDNLEDAKALSILFRKIPATLINLIEYNPIQDTPFKASTETMTQQFMHYLQSQRINVRLRRSKGKDIQAACGQLAARGGTRKNEK